MSKNNLLLFVDRLVEVEIVFFGVGLHLCIYALIKHLS